MKTITAAYTKFLTVPSVGRGQTRVGFRLLVAEGWRLYSDRLQGGVFDQ